MTEKVCTTERNINIDIIKFVATFLVLSFHFIYNNNFYQTTMTCPRMFVMAGMKTFFMMCVPLFILITGYLMNAKTFSAKYYINIKKVVIPYLVLTVITLIVRIILSKYGIFKPVKFSHYINDFLDFKIIGYAWYIDMYLALYVLIPFFNRMFEGDKVQNTLLVWFLPFLTVLPSISTTPTFFISQWTGLWVLTYYCIGAYIQKYKVKLSLKISIPLYVICLASFIIINILTSYGKIWNVHKLDTWGGIENTVTSVLFFLILLNIDFKNLSAKIKNAISYCAKLSLGIYLSSFIFDSIIYHYLNMYITDTTAKLGWYFVTVPVSFVLSVILAKVTENISAKIDNKFFGKTNC